MTRDLWSFEDLVRASGGDADGPAAQSITGMAIDSRALAPGEVFVALKDQRDGHEFVTAAFAAGAAAAIVAQSYVRRPGDGALVRVADPLRALEGIGRAARARLAAQARVIAVTGSVGKTGTKEMLKACLSRLGPTHAADKSFNNHWGVPLTLARMPVDTRYGVFEIGMNHAGEIAPLSRQVRPHVAIITTVEPVHLEFFASVAEIAEAKSEVFAGLEPGGTAVLNRDSPYFDLMRARAEAAGARVTSFGEHANADVGFARLDLGPDAIAVIARLGERRIAYRIGAPGAHIARNSLAVVAAIAAAGADVDAAVGALDFIAASQGRGARTEIEVPGGRMLLIDESYNANPASMRSALAALGCVPRSRFKRRIAVLGDMLELGPQSARLHAEIKEAVDAAGVDLVFACGPNMAHLYAAVPAERRGDWAETSAGLVAALTEKVRSGDAVMVKGSLGSKMALLVTALRDCSTAARATS